MKKTLPLDEKAALDGKWFKEFDRLAAEHGPDRVTYALVTRELHCSTSTIGDRLRRWKLLQASVQGTGIPTGYADLQRQQFELMKAFVSADLEKEKREHDETKTALANSQKQCDLLERDFRSREKALAERTAQLEEALRTKTQECDQRDKVLATQTTQLHEAKASLQHQQELILTLQATVRTQEQAVTELRQQLQKRQAEIERYQRNEDRLNVQLDAERQKLKQLGAPAPGSRPRRLKPKPKP